MKLPMEMQMEIKVHQNLQLGVECLASHLTVRFAKKWNSKRERVANDQPILTQMKMSSPPHNPPTKGPPLHSNSINQIHLKLKMIGVLKVNLISLCNSKDSLSSSSNSREWSFNNNSKRKKMKKVKTWTKKTRVQQVKMIKKHRIPKLPAEAL